MQSILYATILFIFFTFTAIAQNGGHYTFSFLDIPASVHTTALGGIQPAFAEKDLSRAVANPALLNAQLHEQLSLNTMAYYAGINAGYVGYVHHFDSLATFGLGMQYITYGSIEETNIYAQTIGSSNSGEYAFYLSGAKTWGKWSTGINVKLILSNLAQYHASGIATDLGVAYNDTAANFQMGLVFKNIGTQLSSYSGTKEALPFDIQFGISKRLKYVPFRFYATAHHLYKWDLRYDDPTVQTTNIVGEEDTIKRSYFVDKLFRHFIFGTELYLGKVLALQVGYNFLRKQELSLANTRSLTGFSFGIGIYIKRVSVNYGMANLHQAGAVHHFGLNVRFGKNAL